MKLNQFNDYIKLALHISICFFMRLFMLIFFLCSKKKFKNKQSKYKNIYIYIYTLY